MPSPETAALGRDVEREQRYCSRLLHRIGRLYTEAAEAFSEAVGSYERGEDITAALTAIQENLRSLEAERQEFQRAQGLLQPHLAEFVSRFFAEKENPPPAARPVDSAIF